MADRAKHAFGSSERVMESIANGILDSFDILFLDGDTDNPKIGWVDKNGNPVILKDEKADLSELEAEIAKKVDADEVDAKIETAVTDAVTEKVESTISKLVFEVEKEYEIAHKPSGTLVNYGDKEIRIMCPTDTKWTLQNSGDGADANKYYIGFKAYAPEDAASFKEDLAEIITDETMYYFEGNDFAGVDAQGRKYSIVWLPVAAYDETSGTWTYYGANSNKAKYIGWYYSVEWYNADGVIIATDCIRINLSNEGCHSVTTPYYVGAIEKQLEDKIVEIETKIEQSGSGNEIIEF